MFEWPPKLQLAQTPTPLTPLERFSKQFDDLTIWVKHDELTGMEVSGNKIRKLEFSIAQALEDGCDTLITCGGVQSNHCRATAILGARLGLKVRLILRGEKPDVADGNLMLDYLAGAEISYLPVKQWSTHPDVGAQLQKQYLAEGHKACFIPVGASDEIGIWGYIAACAELKQDFENLGLEPDYIVVATGSGGTQGGLIAGRALMGLKARILAFNVCDDAGYFERKIRGDLTLWRKRYGIELDVRELEIDTAEGYVGPGYALAGPEVFATITELARCEALFLDPVYTGKAFHGMVSELQKARQGQQTRMPGAKNVVFIHTGGLFGVFPQKKGFDF
ncbi:MAG: D-cysteine desulfhydrase family protein [Gammaproteobacteria bacterium]|nr:D-cysteine desulfhydrase family protein [Gammaproteobacteria bacterium]